MNPCKMYFGQTSTLPPSIHQKLHKHDRCCMQHNQLPSKIHVGLEDNLLTENCRTGSSDLFSTISSSDLFLKYSDYIEVEFISGAGDNRKQYQERNNMVGKLTFFRQSVIFDNSSNDFCKLILFMGLPLCLLCQTIQLKPNPSV